MDYNIMDYIPNGIIVSNIKKSEIININKVGKKILKINNDTDIKSVKQFITNDDIYQNMRNHIIEDNKKYGKSEGIAYLNALDNTIVEVSFVCVAEANNPNIVYYIFNKAVEVTGEKQISFKELADKLPSGIVVMDIKNELSITYANDEHYKILGINDNDKKIENSKNKYLLKDFIIEEDVNWVMAEIYANFLDNKDVDIEFRMKINEETAKWVRLYGRATISSSGEKLFYSSLTDLSERNYIHDKLHMERLLFHKITELTEDRIFRIDIKNKILHLLGNKNNKFGEIEVFENYEETLLKIDKIYREDIYIYKELIECFENGIERAVELRYLLDKHNKDEFEWYKVTYSFIRNSNGEPLFVIGKLTNIHSQKILEEQARTDLLTHFYNKMTTEHEVDKLIRTQKNQKHAFFIVDIDNFKAINDNLGHHFGDIVLNEIANDIKGCFRTKDILGRICGRKVNMNNQNEELHIRKKDILGRIGGDEFIIVMRNIENEEIILDKAQIICGILDKTFSNKDNTNNYSISASIGVSIYPKHGTTYEELYKKSDIALYDIKKTGKNGYKLYSEDLKEEQIKHDAKSIDNNDYKVMNINTTVVSSVLNLLYETKDLSVSIGAIMMYLGNIYKVDRCYIFEATDIDNSYDNRYKWCRNAVFKDISESIDNKNLHNILNQTDDNGIFYTNDIYTIKDDVIINRLEQEKVQSLFLVESLKEDTERLILGLEDCTSKREWSESEVVTLLHIGRLLFTAVNNDNTIKRLVPKS